MKTKLILIFNAKSEIREYFRHDHRIGFLDSKSFDDWCIDGVRIDPRPDKEIYKNWPEVQKRVRNLGPLFSRHFNDSPRLEMQLSLMAFQVIRLIAALKDVGAEYVIFPTGVSHHLMTAQCEIACSLSGTPQIFTYLTNLSPRVLPMIQKETIKDRKPLRLWISDELIDFPSSIDSTMDYKVVTNRLNEMPVSNFGFAIFQVILLFGHRRLARTKEGVINFLLCRPKSSHNPYVPLRVYSLLTELRLMIHQRQVLKYFTQLVRIDLGRLQYENLDKVNYPVIYAHQQPEATTFPEGGDFQNHIDIAIAFRRNGYEGPIFYLEHPATYNYTSFGASSRIGTMRSNEYYDALRTLGCYLIDKSFVDNHASKLQPITISGSIAVERSFSGKITVVVGEPWYKGLPGTLTIEEYLNGPNLSETRDLKAEAFAFIRSVFNNHSITNGLILKNESNPEGLRKTIFISEYSSLIDGLIKGSI